MRDQTRQIARFVILFLPAPVVLLSLFVGPADTVDPAQLLRWLVQPSSGTIPDEELIRTIIWDVRLPRIVLTFLVGGSLASSGNALQALFRNPLVSPYLLGLSSGAAFGAALALATSWLPLQASAFSSGMAAVGISYFLARTRKSVSVVALILSGIIVTGIFSSLLTIVQFLTDPFRLQTIVHWTMGNLHNASWAKVRSAAPLIVLGTVWLFMLRWRMNVLALGDVEARAVGLNPDWQKVLILVPATLSASASVAVAGVIGLVGLVVPHMVRMMLGPDNRVGVPACFAFGGTFLLIVDDFSRALASFEIPIGIFTTLIGGPFFIYLLKKSRIGWEE
ncbi:MAG: iron ABC transporter permease [Syntrophobacteraceae bacterium]